jgi:hypothetical protein
VGPEEIAGKEDFVLTKVGNLGLRPVCPWGKEKFEGAVAQRQGFFVFDYPETVWRQVEKCDKKVFALLVGHYYSIREKFQDHGQGTRMILFCMVNNNVINPFDIQLDKV